MMIIEVLKGDARSLDNGSNHREGNMVMLILEILHDVSIL